MFDKLVESNKRGRRDVTGIVLGMFTSTTLQAALMTGAVYATMGAVQEVEQILMDTIPIVIDQSDPEPEPDEPDEPVVTSLAPLPKGFQVLAAPVEIPTEIPAVDLQQHFDPRDYTGVGVEGGVFDGDEDVTGPVDGLARLFEQAVVDEKPERISCPTLEYPRLLQEANIEGQVLLRFVVEADGHVLDEHIETLAATHRAFEGPARQMISRCAFRPGRVRANAVRVLVEMPVIFTILTSQ
jgi:TonB family protein